MRPENAGPFAGDTFTTQPFAMKAINYIAATLGIGSFLGFVNLIVGVLSATWLGVQLYGYLAHELPMKRMRRKLLQREMDRTRTQPADFGAMEADE